MSTHSQNEVQLPKTMRALVQTDKDREAQVRDVPLPELEDNEVLVKIAYVAQNPTDWKHAASLSPSGVIHGGDYSGTVVRLGPNLKVPLEVGDKVAGCTHGGVYKDRGAYAQYARIESNMTFKIPPGIKEEEAATYGIAWVTACQAIIDTQGHGFPPDKVSGIPWYVVYGGSTSVGLFAIPLLKAIGYRVLALASPRSFDLVKSYGADAVVDYHDVSQAIEQGKSITGGQGAEYGLDTISEGDSFRLALAIMGEKGRQLNYIGPDPKDQESINPGGKVKLLRTIMYTLFGREFNFTPLAKPTIMRANAHDRAFGEAIFAHTPELISTYGIKPNPTTVRGGLDDVLSGWEEMKAGKVSGTKYVYKLE